MARKARALVAFLLAFVSTALIFLVPTPANAAGLDSLTANPANAPLLMDPNLTSGAVSASTSITAGSGLSSTASGAASSVYTAATTSVPNTINAGTFASSLGAGQIVGGGYSAGSTAASVAGQGLLTDAAAGTGLSLGSAIFGGIGTSIAVLLGGVSTWQMLVGSQGDGQLPSGTAANSTLQWSTDPTKWVADTPVGGAVALSGGVYVAANPIIPATCTGNASCVWGMAASSTTVILGGSVTATSSASIIATEQTGYQCEGDIASGLWTSGVAGQISGLTSSVVGARAWTITNTITRCSTTSLYNYRVRFGTSYDASTGATTGYGPWHYLLMPSSPVSGYGAVHHVEQTVTCTRQNGTTHTITNTTPDQPWTAGTLLTIAGLMCPDGERNTGSTSVVKTPGGSDLPLASQAPTPGSSAVPRACDLAAAHCFLDLTYQASAGATVQSCFSAAAIACKDWMTTVKTQTPTSYPRYACRYGNGGTAAWATVMITDCVIYSNSWKTGTVSEPVPTGGSGGGTTSDNCWAGTFSWNPVDWVLTPVKCALQWAFVPDPTHIEPMVTALKTAWEGTAPQVAISELLVITLPFRNLSTDTTIDCNGPEVDWHWGFLDHAHPFATCNGLPQTLANYFRPILGAVLLLLAFAEGVRTLARTIALEVPESV